MKNCRICKGSNLTKFMDLGVQPHCNSFLDQGRLDQNEPHWPLDLLFCHDCHLVQLGSVVDPDVMFRNYVYVSGTTRSLPEHFRKSAEALVERFALKPGSLVVDIGSNDGTFLNCFKDLGMTVVGVDPATNIAKIANDRGITTINDFFGERAADQILNDYGPASLITAAGVFFHIDDMDDVCRGIFKLLGNTGVLHVQAIYLGAMLDNTSFDNVYHEHVSYYTTSPLMTLFDRFDLEIFDIGFSPIHGGSLLVYASKKGAYDVLPSVAEKIAYEKDQGWYTLDAYLDFAKKVEANKARLLEMLKEIKNRGKTIAAYSAPAKGNTLLNYCGIGTDFLDYAVEKAPLKIGKLTPGMHIPVIDEADVADTPPDYYLLLAWNFKDELLKKNESFRKAGGKFIVPVPVPEII